MELKLIHVGGDHTRHEGHRSPLKNLTISYTCANWMRLLVYFGLRGTWTAKFKQTKRGKVRTVAIWFTILVCEYNQWRNQGWTLKLFNSSKKLKTSPKNTTFVLSTPTSVWEYFQVLFTYQLMKVVGGFRGFLLQVFCNAAQSTIFR